jgi:hypothetical protein
MSAEFVHLSEGRVFWTPTGGSEVELDVREASLTIVRDRAEASGSKGSGWRRRRAGMRDINGTFQLYYKTTEKPYDSTRLIKAGADGTLRLVNGNGDTYSGPVLLGDISDTVYSNEENKVLEIPFEGDGVWTLPS